MPLIRRLLDEASIHRFVNDAAAPARTLLDDVAHWPTVHELVKRINITVYPSSDPGLVAAVQQDPWLQASKYAYGWVYFCMLALAIALAVRLYFAWTDRIRRALHKEAALMAAKTPSPVSDFEMMNLARNTSSANLFPPPPAPAAETLETESSLAIAPIHRGMALIRYFFYRPIPSIRLGKKTQIFFPPASALFFILAALIFVALYCFLPKPLFYDSIRFGSPPLAIRAGMVAVAMVPWIVALSMKANIITIITGIGHERLNVLHRWAGYICLALSLVHTVPFYVQPLWDQGAEQAFQTFFSGQYYVYGTGIAALAPLAFLCVHSLPILRAWMYELFVALHLPAAIVFLAMMFWHCNNYLASWGFLWATVAIWLASYALRVFYLNWTNFHRTSWLRGEEASVTLLPENAVKITIPTQMKWRPGQHVYLRMPGISPLENHPFTIASLCSDDFPSEYGEQYRDLILVFRPFAGFTRKVVHAAQRNGPDHTYRAFLDGPYGGMQRDLAAFESVVLVAGGSGITAIVSTSLL